MAVSMKRSRPPRLRSQSAREPTNRANERIATLVGSTRRLQSMTTTRLTLAEVRCIYSGTDELRSSLFKSLFSTCMNVNSNCSTFGVARFAKIRRICLS